MSKQDVRLVYACRDALEAVLAAQPHKVWRFLEEAMIRAKVNRAQIPAPTLLGEAYPRLVLALANAYYLAALAPEQTEAIAADLRNAWAAWRGWVQP